MSDDDPLRPAVEARKSELRKLVQLSVEAEAGKALRELVGRSKARDVQAACRVYDRVVATTKGRVVPDAKESG